MSERDKHHERIELALRRLAQAPGAYTANEARRIATEAADWMKTLLIDLRGHENERRPTTCFECSTELQGPFCPKCNPVPVGAEELGAIIKEADDTFGYSMNLTRLVDGERTYTLKIVDEPTTEHPGTDECYEAISVAKNQRRAQAILDRLSAPVRS